MSKGSRFEISRGEWRKRVRRKFFKEEEVQMRGSRFQE